MLVLPAWSGNLGSRVTKSGKLLVTDCGLACSLTGLDRERLLLDGPLIGPILENFVAMELTKGISFERHPAKAVSLSYDWGD